MTKSQEQSPDSHNGHRPTYLDQPRLMEFALHPWPFAEKIWINAAGYLLTQGPEAYMVKTNVTDGGQGIYKAMLQGAVDAYRHDLDVKQHKPLEGSMRERIGKILAWGMKWPALSDHSDLDNSFRSFDSALEMKGLSYPGVAKVITGFRGVQAVHQIDLWRIATEGLRDIGENQESRRKMGQDLLADILTVNAYTNVDPWETESHVYKGDLLFWLSVLNEKKISAEIQADGYEAVRGFVDKVMTYKDTFPPNSELREYALRAAAEYYNHLPRGRRIIGLAEMVDAEEFGVARLANDYIESAVRESPDVIVHLYFSLLETHNEEDDRLAVVLLRYLNISNSDVRFIPNSLDSYLSDPSEAIQKTALMSAGHMEKNMSLPQEIRESIRSSVLDTFSKSRNPRIHELCTTLPFRVTPDFALSLVSQALADYRFLAVQMKMAQQMEALIWVWGDEGVLDNGPFNEKVTTLITHYKSEIGPQADTILGQLKFERFPVEAS